MSQATETLSSPLLSLTDRAVEKVSEGETLSVTIDLPEGCVRAEGRIVYYVHNQGFAVQFQLVDQQSSEALKHAVERLLAAGMGT